jgi:hypothetical protein
MSARVVFPHVEDMIVPVTTGLPAGRVYAPPAALLIDYFPGGVAVLIHSS